MREGLFKRGTWENGSAGTQTPGDGEKPLREADKNVKTWTQKKKGVSWQQHRVKTRRNREQKSHQNERLTKFTWPGGAFWRGRNSKFKRRGGVKLGTQYVLACWGGLEFRNVVAENGKGGLDTSNNGEKRRKSEIRPPTGGTGPGKNKSTKLEKKCEYFSGADREFRRVNLAVLL